MTKVFELDYKDGDKITIYEEDTTYSIKTIDRGTTEKSNYYYSENYPKGFKWSEEKLFQHGMLEMDKVIIPLEKLN